MYVGMCAYVRMYVCVYAYVRMYVCTTVYVPVVGEYWRQMASKNTTSSVRMSVTEKYKNRSGCSDPRSPITVAE